MNNYNLLTRSAYTFFNSLLKIDDIIDYAVKNNLSNAFLVDKNYMHGTMEFYFKALKKGIKPIIGLEVDFNNQKLVFVAKNFNGYRELMKLSSTIALKETDKLTYEPSPNVHQVKVDLPIVSFIKKSDKKTLKMFSSISNLELTGKESHFLTKEEMSKEAITEIDKIIKEVNLVIPEQKNVLPNYIKDGKKVNSSEFFQKLLNKGLKNYIISNKIKNSDEYTKRIKYEYDVITKMGYANYFLIVWDIVKFARDNDIYVGPGRGSAAGSLVSFVLGITTIDPIKNGLLFERFLNEERISMPDIDIDFDDKRRSEIIEHIINKYGNDRVAQIITFQTLRARMSIKDIARINNVPSSQSDVLSKAIPEGATLREAYKENKAFKLAVDSSSINTEIFKSAKLIERLPRQHSTHAAGIVLSPVEIYKNVPVQKGYENIHLTQYSMQWMEINGLLKIDILGLRNLSFMDEILKLIGKKIDINKIPLNRPEVYKLLSAGMTVGIFQLESPGMTKVLKQMQPTEFEDIVATTSLFRPGPMKQIPLYIKRKNGESKIEYPSKEIEDILKSTYGIIIYQEQIMQIAQKFSGLSLARADILRRAIGKKDISLIHELKDEFIKGSIENGNDEKEAKKIYDLIYEFSEYGFNRSHAFAYSIISYQLAYLKANYPKEFITALLNSIIGNVDKTTAYINETIKMGIKVLKPSINKSLVTFIIEDDAIRFGLLPIKGIGVTAVKEILDERSKGEFEDFSSTVARLIIRKVTSANIILLIKAGAFDDFGSRSKLLHNLEQILQYAEMIKVKSEDGFILDYSIAKPPVLKEATDVVEDADYDFEAFGFIITEHPFAKIKKQILKIAPFTSVEDVSDNQDEPVTVAGVIVSVRKLTTKTNMEMAFASLEDETGRQNLTLWPTSYKKFAKELKVGNIVYIVGKVDVKRNKTIIVNSIKLVKK